MHIGRCFLSRLSGVFPLLLTLWPAAEMRPHVSGPPPVMVPQCPSVVLHAAFLAEENTGQGTGFLLILENRRAIPVQIPMPMPLSVDWYGKEGTRWSWRASSGTGGSLVDALNARGPVFAMQAESYNVPWELVQVAPHETYTWAVFSRSAPALNYRPGCEHCSSTTTTEFQAVLAYGFLAKAKAGAPAPLSCGLRSNAIVMPPLARASLGSASTK